MTQNRTASRHRRPTSPMRALLAGVILLLTLLAGPPATAEAARIKDIAAVKGVRPNQLVGYGLVVGLNGSGDNNKTEFTIQSLVNMLERMDVHVDPNDVKVKNVAAVIVTASLPPFSRIGNKIDVLVSSIGDAKSLVGGTLLLTPLRGVDREVYALAQGPVSVGGFGATGTTGSAVTQNHLLAAKIPGGATVEKEIPFALAGAAGADVDPFFSRISPPRCGFRMLSTRPWAAPWPARWTPGLWRSRCPAAFTTISPAFWRGSKPWP